MYYILVVILQFAPFWTIPIAMIAGQFAYLYWLKGRKEVTFAMGGLIFICMAALIYYVWAGGHTGVAKEMLHGK